MPCSLCSSEHHDKRTCDMNNRETEIHSIYGYFHIETKELLYIGRTINIIKRDKEHLSKQGDSPFELYYKENKDKIIIKKLQDNISYDIIKDIEREYLHTYLPPYNIKGCTWRCSCEFYETNNKPYYLQNNLSESIDYHFNSHENDSNHYSYLMMKTYIKNSLLDDECIAAMRT